MAVGDVTPRPKVEVYPSFLKELLAGDSECEYAPWWQSRNKVESDQTEWEDYRVKHAEQVKKRAEELKALGYTVTTEDQNWIRVTGKVMAGGKVDIIASKEREILIPDIKTGKRRASDLWQVRFYMFLASLLTLPRFTGKTILGEVVYGDDVKLVKLTADHRRRIQGFLVLMGGPEPEKTPSSSACRYCNVVGCDARVESDGMIGSAQGLF